MILQQDAFDKIDSVCPIERQQFMLNLVMDICRTKFDFSNFNEVMDYFKRMINICKQMNYSAFQSDAFEGYLKDLKEMLTLETAEK